MARPALAAALALALVLGAVAGALAAPGKGKGGAGDDPAREARARALAQAAASLGFKDLHEAAWALKHIAELSLKGVIKGRGEGKVAPNAAVSRAEVLAMLARATGHEERAQQLAAEPCTLPFADAKAVSASARWAVGYVCVALEQGWIAGEGKLQPQKAASRAWVAQVLVAAAGVPDAELQAAAGQPLAFKDADAIPAEVRAHVAVAVARGLIGGYEDGTFKPHKPVTRAELAAMLSRLLGQGDASQPPAARAVRGWLKAVQGGQLVVAVRQGDAYVDQTLALAAQAVVFLGEQPATLADLRPGDRVELFLDPQGKVSFVFARYEAIELEGRVEAVGQANLTLRLDEVDVDWDDNPVPLPVTYAPGQTVTLAVYAGAQVRTGGQVRAWSPDLVRPGDRVKARVHVDTVVSLRVQGEDRGEAEGARARFAGVLVAKEAVQGGTRIQVRVTDNDRRRPVAVDAQGVATLVVPAGAELRLRGRALAWEAVPAGSVLAVELQGGTAVRVTVERLPGADDRATGRFRGEIAGINLAGAQATLTVRVLGEVEGLLPGPAADGTVQVRVTPRTRIAVDGQAAAPADLRVGDAGRFTVDGETLLRLEVARR